MKIKLEQLHKHGHYFCCKQQSFQDVKCEAHRYPLLT